MKEQSTYQQALRDPRWQKKRLELFEASHWTCECCGEKTKELHVHHLLYKKGLKPWEYDQDQLMCVCSTCHEQIGAAKQLLDEAILNYVRGCGPHHASDVYKMLTSFLWCYMCPGPNVDNIKAFTPGERIGGFAGELSALREKYGKGGL